MLEVELRPAKRPHLYTLNKYRSWYFASSLIKYCSIYSPYKQKMGFVWLCCYACSGKAEWEDFTKKMLGRIVQHLQTATVKVYLVAYLVYGKGEIKDGLSIRNGKIYPGTKYTHINDALQQLLKAKYDGFVYTGHSSGYVFGVNVKPAFSLKDLCSWIPSKLKAIIFDSCYCGTLECMYELHNCVKYAITAPIYHEETILAIKEFYNYTAPLENYLGNIVRAFPVQGNQRYSLRLSLVNIDEIPPLVRFIKKHWNRLSWEKGKAYEKDNYLYHICEVVGNLSPKQQQEFSNLLNKALLLSEAKQKGRLYGPPHLCLGLYREPPEPIAEVLSYFQE